MKRLIVLFFAALAVMSLPAQTEVANSILAISGLQLADSVKSAGGSVADSIQKAREDSIAARTKYVQDSIANANLDIWRDYDMQEVVVKAMAPRVMVKGDTVQFNASQFRTAEGSVVEDLVAKLPGAEVGDDGTVKINGKTVKKILVDGKEFMTGDTKTALKNLPTAIIDKIKTYDQKSDLARITGIEDGEEETVLDFGIKPGMNKGTMVNADLAIGTHKRFAERVFGGWMQDPHKLFFMGSMNNTNDMGFPGGGGGRRYGGGGAGDNISKMAGLNYNLDTKKLKLDASIRWNHNNGDTRNESNTENFVVQKGKFSNSLSQSYSRSNSWNGQLRLEWQPTENTNIMFRPSFTLSSSDNASGSSSETYDLNDDVKDYVNLNSSTNLSYSTTNSLNGMLQFNQKLSQNGRNITLRLNGSLSDGDSKSMSTNEVALKQFGDSTYHTYRYNLTPTKRYSYSARVTYSEPLFDRAYLQFQYSYTYNFNKSDRATYDFSKIPGLNYSGIGIPEFRDWDSYLRPINYEYEQYKDDSLSRYSEYKNYIHEVQLTFRMVREKFQLNVGAMMQPQKTKFMQDYRGVVVDTIRNVNNFSPTLDFRYNFSKQHRLRVNYRGRTSQPSITDLLDITDDSNPLNITKGNPGLKPSFSHNVFAYYNNYITHHQQAIMANVNFTSTANSIANKVTYIPETGGRITRPENIDGNWNVGGSVMYNTSLDSAGVWYTNLNTSVNYSNTVGFLQVNQKADSQESVTRATVLRQRLTFGFRNDWLDVSLDGNFTYDHSVNLLESSNNMDTKEWNFGGTIQLFAPWGMEFSTNLHQQMRRGYRNESMNTNELIWNAQLSQSFLKNKSLVVTLQYNDILHQSSAISRTITAMQIGESRNNSVLSYGMIHLIYRFNAFGGKAARQGGGGGPGGMMPPGGGRMGGGRMGGGGMGRHPM